MPVPFRSVDVDTERSWTAPSEEVRLCRCVDVRGSQEACGHTARGAAHRRAGVVYHHTDVRRAFKVDHSVFAPVVQKSTVVHVDGAHITAEEAAFLGGTPNAPVRNVLMCPISEGAVGRSRVCPPLQTRRPCATSQLTGLSRPALQGKGVPQGSAANLCKTGWPRFGRGRGAGGDSYKTVAAAVAFGRYGRSVTGSCCWGWGGYLPPLQAGPGLRRQQGRAVAYK